MYLDNVCITIPCNMVLPHYPIMPNGLTKYRNKFWGLFNLIYNINLNHQPYMTNNKNRGTTSNFGLNKAFVALDIQTSKQT